MPDVAPPFTDQPSLRQIAAEIMTVDETTQVELSRPGGKVSAPCFRGQLRGDPESAYAYVAPRFREQGHTAMLQQADKGGVALIAMPGLTETTPSRLWVALLLFALTIISTAFVGGFTEVGYSLGQGLAFSAALLSILLAHEMGHYLVARRMGVAVSYPFFLPVPLPPLGTMGAFISIKEPPPNRKTILAIGIAGPLAGLVVAIPVLLLGLNLSEVRPLVPLEGGFVEGNSLIYAAMKIAVFGRFLPSGGEDVFLHPVALAGWAGLLVTGLNLIPAGQLDGGHIFFALFGPRVAQYVTMVIAVALLGLGFVWSGWFIWAVLVAVFGLQRTPLLNEVAPLRGGWRLLAIGGLLLFVLAFIPVPITQL